jgi:hypothetical protein
MGGSVQSAGSSPTVPTSRRKRPSIGFVAICVAQLALVGFVAWGLSEPPLDRVWTLHHELKIGTRGAPKREDLPTIRAALRRHPTLGRALLHEGSIGLLSAHDDGWLDTPTATVLRLAGTETRAMRIEIGTPEDLLPFDIEVEGDGFQHALTAREHGVLVVVLPAASDHDELFTVHLKGRKLRADPSMLNVRVTFEEGTAS